LDVSYFTFMYAAVAVGGCVDDRNCY